MPQPGEFWLADIPFTTGAASKLRAVLVLWTDAADVVVAAVTSAQPRSKTDLNSTLQNSLAVKPCDHSGLLAQKFPLVLGCVRQRSSWLALILTYSPWEKERTSAAPAWAQAGPANPGAGIARARPMFHPLH